MGAGHLNRGESVPSDDGGREGSGPEGVGLWWSSQAL